jgi:hypothetical protein
MPVSAADRLASRFAFQPRATPYHISRQISTITFGPAAGKLFGRLSGNTGFQKVLDSGRFS